MVPLMTALIDVFPNALAALAKHTLYGSQKHNPGGTKHWAYHVSTHHVDACVGHLANRGIIDPESGVSHTVAAFWRAAAALETELIEGGAKPGRSVDFERGAMERGITAGEALKAKADALREPDGHVVRTPSGAHVLVNHPAQLLAVAAFKAEELKRASMFPPMLAKDYPGTFLTPEELDEPTCWACGRNVLSVDTLCLPCQNQRREEDGHE